jgi:arylamine N-acetyltransferase
LNNDWTRRYLQLLNIDYEAPSTSALDAIARNHRKVLFENVSSLLRRSRHVKGSVPPIDTDRLLSEWEQGTSGGLCFDVAAMLARLLPLLGYDTAPIAGQITFPGSHQALMVHLHRRRYLVDAGNGAPFFEAIPVDETFEVARAGLSYRFHLDSRSDVLVQDRLIHEQWQRFSEYELRPASQQDRDLAYQRHHRPGEGWVVGSLRLVRCLEDEVLQLAAHEFTRFTQAGKHSEEVYGVRRYRELVADVFGAPQLPIAAGLRAWSELTGAKV